MYITGVNVVCTNGLVRKKNDLLNNSHCWFVSITPKSDIWLWFEFEFPARGQHQYRIDFKGDKLWTVARLEVTTISSFVLEKVNRVKCYKTGRPDTKTWSRSLVHSSESVCVLSANTLDCREKQECKWGVPVSKRRLISKDVGVSFHLKVNVFSLSSVIELTKCFFFYAPDKIWMRLL